MSTNNLPDYARYLIEMLNIQPGSSNQGYRHEYREAGEILVGTTIWTSGMGSGDGDGVDSTNLDDDDDEDTEVINPESEPQGLCPLLLCIAQEQGVEHPHNYVEAALMVYKDGRTPPPTWSEQWRDSVRNLGVAGIVEFSGGGDNGYTTGPISIVNKYAERMNGQYVEEEIRKVLQEMMTELGPVVVADHMLDEGWCSLRAEGHNDPLFLIRSQDMGGILYTYILNDERQTIALMAQFESI